MDDLKLFGRRVRTVREAAGKTRETAAEVSGITPNYLGEIERGNKWPSLEVISSLASAFGVSPGAFFDFEAEETDRTVLASQLQEVLATRSIEQLQLSLRVLKSIFHR